jgi:hypothetical protein
MKRIFLGLFFIIIGIESIYCLPNDSIAALISINNPNTSSKLISEPKGKPKELYKPSIEDGTIWRVNSDIKPLRLSVVLGGIIVADAIGYKRLTDTWYKTETSSFHFHYGPRDIKEYKQMDKIGHVMDSYYISHLTSKIYRWAGVSAKSSIWFGSLTGFLWMLQIEISDAFFEAWGFSYYDFAANVIGSGYSALQQFHPYPLKGIRFKFSLWPSQAYKQGLYSEVSNSLIDDYEGFTWWLAFNIHDIIPSGWRRSYPGWLSPWGLAVGHSIQNLGVEGVFGGQREVFIGLDFDLTKIYKGDSHLLKFLLDELNFIRLPLPAVRLTPSGIWYGFYF